LTAWEKWALEHPVYGHPKYNPKKRNPYLRRKDLKI